MTICLLRGAIRSVRVVTGRGFVTPSALLLCGVLSSLLAGCGTSNELGRLPVSGTVQLDGQPLDSGTISFQPTGQTGTSAGSAIEAGQYNIAAERGLPPGTYLVRISAPSGTAAPSEMPGESVVQEERIPAAWNTDSNETVEVKAGETNTFSFEIDSAS